MGVPYQKWVPTYDYRSRKRLKNISGNFRADSQWVSNLVQIFLINLFFCLHFSTLKKSLGWFSTLLAIFQAEKNCPYQNMILFEKELLYRPACKWNYYFSSFPIWWNGFCFSFHNNMLTIGRTTGWMAGRIDGWIASRSLGCWLAQTSGLVVWSEWTTNVPLFSRLFC